MANIIVNLSYKIFDGAEITFKSPADCSNVTGLRVRYPIENNMWQSQEFKLADAHKNDVAKISELFSENAMVKVILDTEAGMAFVQNADTNAYLEGRFKELTTIIDISDKFVSVDNLKDSVQPAEFEVVKLGSLISGTLTFMIDLDAYIKDYPDDYGITLPVNELYRPSHITFPAVSLTMFNDDGPIFDNMPQVYVDFSGNDLQIQLLGQLNHMCYLRLSFSYVCGDRINGWSP